MNFAWCSNFDSGNLLSLSQTAQPSYITQKEIQMLPRYPVSYFNFECRPDKGETQFKSYFNFIMKQSSTQQHNLALDQFSSLPKCQFEPQILVFTWTNPPNTKRLITNLYRPVYRFFEEKPRRKYYQHPDIHDVVMSELAQVDQRLISGNDYFPDYQQVFWINTNPARQVSESEPKLVFYIIVEKPCAEQVLQIAYCCPYSLSHMYFRFFSFACLQDAFPERIIYQQQIIGYSNLRLPLFAFKFKRNDVVRPQILITARIHPGETLTSFLLDSLVLSFLNQKIRLLDHFDVHIIPSLNPDGCYLGNYRSDDQGYNLNRCYGQNDARADQYPCNIAVKGYIRQISPLIVIDLHNHASILSAVLFGNDLLSDAKQQGIANLKPAAIDQVINLLLCKRLTLSSFFNTSKCDFSYARMDSEDGHGEGFDGTLRVVAARELGVKFVFTLETHYFCYEVAGKRRFWFLKEFQTLGEILSQALCDFDSQQGLKLHLERICQFLPSGFELKRWFIRGQRLEEDEVKQQYERIRRGQ